MKNETGQVVLVLILVMTVALAIGISVIQRSISDISTASKVEQSSRAFSAAEAGIERTLGTGNTSLITLQNNAQVQATDTGLIPAAAAGGAQQNPLEYPPLSKEEVAQVWLANPDSVTSPPAGVYKKNSLDIYWGNSSTDRAALELTLIYYDGVSQYKSQKWFLDQIARSPSNNFDTSANCAGGLIPPASSTAYQCKKNISLPAAPASLMLLRARLLYNTTSQPFAVQPPSSATCGADCSVPPQARIVISTGTAGTTQRKVKLFQINKIVPPYFDYAIFSTGAINK